MPHQEQKETSESFAEVLADSMKNPTGIDEITDEFLWGSEVLVAPVITEGAVERKVTFPAGQWVDMAHPCKVYDGYTTINYPAPLDVIPLFVKAGAFIPTADYKMENTGDYNPEKLTVNYYPVENVNSQFTLFDDNKLSTGTISSGEYRLIKFTGSNGGSQINATCEGSYPGAPTTINITFVIHRAASPAKLLVNGRNLTPKFNAENHTLTFNIRWPVDRALNIDAKNLKLCSQE